MASLSRREENVQQRKREVKVAVCPCGKSFTASTQKNARTRCHGCDTKAWRLANPERAKAIRQKSLAARSEAAVLAARIRQYSISVEDFNAMLDAQAGRCAGCLLDRPLCVDHAHDASRKVRGLLCHQCNVSLGLLADNKDTLRRLAGYLEAQ